MGKAKAKNAGAGGGCGSAAARQGEEWVDPHHIRFTHSGISPKFSCGRDVRETLQELLEGRLKVADLPKIQLIKEGDTTYFSQNNRRLWVLKQCREHGLLRESGDRILARVQLLSDAAKSRRNRDRWSVERCADTCTFLTEVQLRKLHVSGGGYGKTQKLPRDPRDPRQAKQNDGGDDCDEEEHGDRDGLEGDAATGVTLAPVPSPLAPGLENRATASAGEAISGGSNPTEDEDEENAEVRLPTACRGGSFAALLDAADSSD